MNHTLMSLLAIAAIVRKKESAVEPFKRTAKLVDDRYEAAVLDLECATSELVQALKKRLNEES
jgi:hypothetical protein